VEHITTETLGQLVCNLLSQHIEACNNAGDGVFCDATDLDDAPGIECIDMPEGDASNLYIELSNGQRFRVQIYAR
jgi:hypothetical protein